MSANIQNDLDEKSLMEGKISRKIPHIIIGLILGGLFVVLAIEIFHGNSKSLSQVEKEKRVAARKAEAKDNVRPNLQLKAEEQKIEKKQTLDELLAAANTPNASGVSAERRSPSPYAANGEFDATGSIPTKGGGSSLGLVSGTEDAAEYEKKKQQVQVDLRKSPLISIAAKSSASGGDADTLSDTELKIKLLKQQQAATTPAGGAIQNSALNDRLALLQKGAGAGESKVEGGNNENLAQFVEHANKSSRKGAIVAEGPGDPNTIYQGSIVRAVTRQRIDCQQPTSITAHITRDVYDTVRNQRVLIPAGSRVVGICNANIDQASTRVAVAFERIIFPNGADIRLGGMTAADAEGVGGLTGDVDDHFWTQFRAAFAISLIQVGTDVISNKNSNGNGSSSNSQIVMNSAGATLGDVAKRSMDRYTKMAPTIAVPAGETFLIQIKRDIVVPNSVFRKS
ncbi:TrbI/VirB10 family protein [Iodobacter sp. HSC-16F04]|uniref:TrbI/VirB10 family protein n=1 Tax=Iodobacter violaceini TaxID=3044271 RepID=A0ABX0KW99_9NEIS|nr:TrbI/VirB10 family protein [Iodobacter violacea]NHQ86752.1 TrbI/VirB10 family protein [Iodobacter violacea]